MFPSIQGEIPFLDDTSNYSNTCELPHFFPHIINRKWPKKNYISQHLSFQIPRKWRCHAMPKSQISSWALSISPGRFPQCSRGRWLCPRVLVLEPSGSVFNSDVEKPMGKKKKVRKMLHSWWGVNIYVSLRAIIKRWLKSFPESIKEYHWSSKSSHSTTENFGYSEPSGNGMCTIQSWDSVRKKKGPGSGCFIPWFSQDLRIQQVWFDGFLTTKSATPKHVMLSRWYVLKFPGTNLPGRQFHFWSFFS